jgi:hypothetical protein
VKLSQTALIDRVISLADAYPSKTPLLPNIRLSKADSPKTDAEKAAVAHLQFRQLEGSCTLQLVLAPTLPTPYNNSVNSMIVLVISTGSMLNM